MNAREEINAMVKKSYAAPTPPAGMSPSRQHLWYTNIINQQMSRLGKPRTYLPPNGTKDSEIPELLAKLRNPKPNTSPEASAVTPRWDNGQMKSTYTKQQIASAPSTKMMANMNRQLTEADAYKEIMRRRPGMSQSQAKALAPLVAKNYRIDANGNWVSKSRMANRNIVSAFRGRAGTSVAGAPAAVRTGV